MTSFKHLLIALLLTLGSGFAQAQSPLDAFSRCLADNTTGKDRKDLARWLFVAMGAHADMKAIAKIEGSAPEQTSREAGQLFTRLLTATCAAQAQAAVKGVGAGAIQSAFTVLGQLAMQELMTDKDVQTNMALLQKYMDAGKMQSVLGLK